MHFLFRYSVYLPIVFIPDINIHRGFRMALGINYRISHIHNIMFYLLCAVILINTPLFYKRILRRIIGFVRK
jgi:hypothetical protein